MIMIGFKVISRLWLANDSDFTGKLRLLTVPSTNI